MLSARFEPGRHDHLADLALVAQVLAHQQVLHHLLGDGGAALRPPRLRQIAHEGTDQSALVDAFVLEEALVFRGDERLLHLLGDVGEGDPDAALVLLEHLREPLPLAIEHDAGARQLEPAQLVVIRQVGGGLVVEIDHVGEIDRRLGHLLALAIFPIGGVEVAKVQSPERLDVAGDRLRVVERRG